MISLTNLRPPWNGSSMIKAIIFDFAGVIGSDGYWIWLKEKFPSIEGKKGYFQEISEQVDKGIITNQEFAHLLSEKTGIPHKDIWPQIYGKIIINDELLLLIKELKKGYKIGLLTNYTYEWLDEIFSIHNLSQYFDVKLISSKYGIIKPEQESFRKILEMLDVKKGEAIFIDDRQSHVDASNKLGLKAFLYENLKKLKEDLNKIDVIT